MIRKKRKQFRLGVTKPLRGGTPRIPSDVLGSYTGTDAGGEAPEQDADDL